MGESTETTGKPFPGHEFDTFDGCVAAVGDEVEDPEGFCNWLEEEGEEALSDPNAQEVLSFLEVEFVSAVDHPAQDSEWVIAKDAEGPDGESHRWQTEATLYVRKDEGDDDVKQVAFAPVLIPKEADKQGDVIPEPAIEGAAHKYLAEYRKVDSDHDLRDGKGTPVESWTLKQDTTFDLPDGSESRTYPEGTWVMGIKFDDETWSRVVSGELSGLSIYGGAKPVDVDALLGKDTATATKSDDGTDDGDVDDSQSMGSEDDDPGDTGNDDTEPAWKQDLSADEVSTLLSAFGSMVENGTVGRDASVEDFVQTILTETGVNEQEVTGLSVFLGADGGDGGDMEPDADEDEDGDEDEDDGGIDMSDEDAGKDADGDGDTDDDGDVGSDADGDTDDVGKSVNVDDDAGVDELRSAVADLTDTVKNLKDKVEDRSPRGGRMEEDDELSDRLAKDLTGKDDADVARKAIREQVEKSDGDDDGPSVDYDGITDGEDADDEASSGGSAAHSSAANTRMAGTDD